MAKAELVKAKKGKQTTTFVRSAYEKVWKNKGWEEVKDASTSQPAPPAPTRTQNEPSKE